MRWSCYDDYVMDGGGCFFGVAGSGHGVAKGIGDRSALKAFGSED